MQIGLPGIEEKVISTIGHDQDEILQNILKLHIESQTFDCDPTFGKGNFYKNISLPQHKFDIAPRFAYVHEANCTNLPLDDGGLKSVIFDPPFVCGHKTANSKDEHIPNGLFKDSVKRIEKDGVIKSSYGSYRTIKELWMMYGDAMTEFHRILQPNGWLVFKCQDTVQDHKNYFSHVEIMNMAVKRGFYPKDFFILIAKSRLRRANQANQEHARKYHSYFWVLQKRESRVAYT